MSEITKRYMEIFEEEMKAYREMSEPNANGAVDSFGLDSDEDMRTVYYQRYVDGSMTEEDLKSKSLLTYEDAVKAQVVRAFCPECGGELRGECNPKSNEHTGIVECINQCDKCHKEYNLDHRYPYVAIKDETGSNIII